MGTYIIIAILLIAVIFAMKGSIKHAKGEGGCCGGGSVPKVKKQKIKNHIAVKNMTIEGMTCANCKKRVENTLNLLNQVNAKVNLEQKKAVITLGEEISDEILIETVENMGYQVTSITNVEA